MTLPLGTQSPDFAEPLLGYRVWVLDRMGHLRAVIVDTERWRSGVNEATCWANKAHHAPHPGCGCGFNALHRAPHDYLGDAGHALGAIAAWGEIDLYEAGFRASHACVLALAESPRISGSALHAEKLKRASDRYGVPLVSLADLGTIARRYARPVAPAELPRRRHRRPPARPPRRIRAVPRAALPAATKGHGMSIAAHLALSHQGTRTRVGPTPAIAAAVGGELTHRVVRGERLEEGSPLFDLGAGTRRLLCPSPVAGRVTALADPAGADLSQGAGGGGWAVEIPPDPVPTDYWPVVWGASGADRYRDAVLAAGSDADLLASPLADDRRVRGDLAEATARSWLRAFCRSLEREVAADRPALELLDLAVRFRLPAGEEVSLSAPSDGEPGCVRLGLPSAAAGICFDLDPAAFALYWRGELRLRQDGVLIAASKRGAKASPRLWGALTAGTCGQAQFAISIHRRWMRRAAAILEELGNPWFRAGDTVRDAARNRQVLGGCESERNAA